MAGTYLLETRNLTKEFSRGAFFKRRGLIAVDDVSFSIPVEKPEIFTLVGESGSGKTTTIRLILGFMKPTSGEVLYGGKSLWAMNKSEQKNYHKEVQAVFQDPYASFNPLKMIDDVLTTPLRMFKLVSSEKEAYEIIYKRLEGIGLDPTEMLGKYPYQLSGGQRQRIMLARAVLLKPKLIVADEPVSMLDASLRAGVLSLMLDLKMKQGVSCIYITHDLSTAYQISDDIAVMYLGSIVEMGPINEIIEEPLHPYTQLLIGSIPIPDPEQRWQKQLELQEIELYNLPSAVKSCKFCARCPKKNEKCAMQRPTLTDVGNNHFVACYLYH